MKHLKPALRIAVACACSLGLGVACPGIMFTINPTLFNLGDLRAEEARELEINGRATSLSWSGVDLRVSGSGPVRVTGSNVEGFSPGSGDAFRLRVSYVPTGIGMQQAFLNVQSVCAPNFPGNSVSLNLNYNGIAGVLPTFMQNSSTLAGGDPVSLATGEYFGHDEKADIDLGGPLPLTFRRYYAAYLRANQITSSLGNNWMHNFDVRLTDGATTATITLFRGKRVVFNKSGTTYTTGSTERQGHQLFTIANGFQFVDVGSDLIYAFNASGQLTKVEDRNGNALSVTQGAGGVGPSQVADALGRTLTFTYSSGKLTRVQDNTARGVAFEYTEDNLTAVTDANTKRWAYSYSGTANTPSLMTAETRPVGNRPFVQEFNAQGRVSRQTRATGGAVQFTYGASATAATTAVSPLGVSVAATHDAALNLQRLTDASNQSIVKTYDTRGRLLSSTDRNGGRASFRYLEPSGQIAGWTDESGLSGSITFQNQTQGNATFQVPTRLTFPDGNSIALGIDTKGNTTSITDQSGNTWQARYDARGLPEAITNPLGATMTYTLSLDGTIASYRIDSGEVTRFTYNARRLPNLVENPDNTTARSEYDSRDNLTRYTNERGFTASFQYDDNNIIRSFSDFSGNLTLFANNNDDHLTTMTDAAGLVTRLTYDAVGRLTAITGSTGLQANFAYDTLNRLTSIRDAAAKGYSFEYDRNGRIVGVTDGMNRTRRSTLDSRGLPTRFTSATGDAANAEYDTMRRLTKWIDALNRTTTFQFDLRGGVSRLVAPGGIAASYERSPLGQVTRATDPQGAIWTFAFERMGKLSSRTDPLGRVIGYSYDNRQRLSTITLPLGALQLRYDASGNRTVAEYSDGLVANFTYDSNNDLTGADGISLVRDKLRRVASSNGIRMDRDGSGRITSVTYAEAKVVRYSYDNRGNLTRVSDWTGSNYDLAYNDAGELLSATLPNGIVQSFTYDGNGLPAAIRALRGGQAISSIALRRDAIGRITSADRAVPSATESVHGSREQSFDNAQQAIGLEHDAMGRVTRDPLRGYEWNLASQLKAYSGADGRAEFGYDALGMRTSSGSGASSRSYVYNYGFDLPSMCILRSGSTDLQYFIYTPDGSLIASIGAADNQRRYYHFDESGNTIFITDAAGSVTHSYSYTPFGETVGSTGDSDNLFTWRGQEGTMREGNTGLYYMRARYYDAIQGRFLSKDPIPSLSPRGLNPYQYAGGSPLQLSDPSGLQVSPVGSSGNVYIPSANGALLNWVTGGFRNYGFLLGQYSDFRLSTFHAMTRGIGAHFDAYMDFYNVLGRYGADEVAHNLNYGLVSEAGVLVRQHAFDPGTLTRGHVSVRPWLPSATQAATEEWARNGHFQKIGTGAKIMGGLAVGVDVGLTIYDGVIHGDSAPQIILDSTANGLGDVATFAAPPLAVADLVTLGGVSGGISNAIKAPVDVVKIAVADKWTPADSDRVKQRFTNKIATKAVWWFSENVYPWEWNPLYWGFVKTFETVDQVKDALKK